jgi:hypothetical protein
MATPTNPGILHVTSEDCPINGMTLSRMRLSKIVYNRNAFVSIVRQLMQEPYQVAGMKQKICDAKGGDPTYYIYAFRLTKN